MRWPLVLLPPLLLLLLLPQLLLLRCWHDGTGTPWRTSLRVAAIAAVGPPATRAAGKVELAHRWRRAGGKLAVAYRLRWRRSNPIPIAASRSDHFLLRGGVCALLPVKGAAEGDRDAAEKGLEGALGTGLPRKNQIGAGWGYWS